MTCVCITYVRRQEEELRVKKKKVLSISLLSIVFARSPFSNEHTEVWDNVAKAVNYSEQRRG